MLYIHLVVEESAIATKPEIDISHDLEASFNWTNRQRRSLGIVHRLFPTNGSAKDTYWHEDMTAQCPSGTTASLSQPPQARLLVKPFARNDPSPDHFCLAVLLVNETRHYRGFAFDVSIQVCREICLFMKPVYANPAGASRSAFRGLKCKAVFRSCCGLKGRCRISSASDSLSGGV